MDKKESNIYDLEKEIDGLKNKIHYFAGSLETINYLLSTGNEENMENHLSHIKEITSRMINEIKNDLIDLN